MRLRQASARADAVVPRLAASMRSRRTTESSILRVVLIWMTIWAVRRDVHQPVERPGPRVREVTGRTRMRSGSLAATCQARPPLSRRYNRPGMPPIAGGMRESVGRPSGLDAPDLPTGRAAGCCLGGPPLCENGPMDELLRAEGLTKHYGSTIALDSVDFSVNEGITGLLGPNGGGKEHRHPAVPRPDRPHLGPRAGDGRRGARQPGDPPPPRVHARARLPSRLGERVGAARPHGPRERPAGPPRRGPARPTRSGTWACTRSATAPWAATRRG